MTATPQICSHGKGHLEDCPDCAAQVAAAATQTAALAGREMTRRAFAAATTPGAPALLAELERGWARRDAETVNPGGPSCGHPRGRCACPTPPISKERLDTLSAAAAALAVAARKNREAGDA